MTTYDLYKASQLLQPLIGFRQTVAKKEYLDLASSLIPDLTKGQIYVNSLSEMFLSVESLSNGLEFDEGYDVDLWDIGTPYVVGDRVKKIVNNRTYVWVSVQAGTGQDPESSPLYWKTALSERLENFRHDAAIETISSAIANQTIEGFTSELNDSTTVYKETATAQPAQLSGRFVGLAITPKSFRLNRVLKIDKIGLRITGAAADVNIYLYHSSKKDAIQTFVIPSAEIDLDTHKWYDLVDGESNPIIVDLYNLDYNQGGRFYLGFYESELASNGQGYKFNEAYYPYNILGRLYQNQYFSFDSIEILSQSLNGVELPNIGQYYDGSNYNTQIAFNCSFDISQSFFPYIEKHVTLFQKVYQYNLAVMLLKSIMQNDRINSITDNAQAKIDELLFGVENSTVNKGLISEKMQFEKKLNNDLNQIFDNFQGAYDGSV